MIKKISILLLAVFITFGAIAQEKKDGIQFYRYNKFQSAIKVLEPLADKDVTANYYLGLSYLAQDDLAKAREIFQRNASNYANMAGIARVLFKENKIVEAKAMLENVVRKTSRKNKSAYLYAADAITYTKGGDLNKAIEWYDYYLDWKKSARALIHKGDALWRMQRGGDAMTAYQDAEKTEAYASLASYRQGELWYANKNMDKVLASYQRSIAADANNPLPYYELSMAYYNIGKYSRAKTQIEKYLELSDKSADDQIQYANLLYLSKDHDGAIKKMTELLNSGNGKPYMYRVLGYSYLEKKNSAEALKNMDLLFEKNPKEKMLASDYITMGRILSTDSIRAGEAQGFFEKGIAADTAKDKTALYRQLAEGFKGADDYKNAAVWYSKIIETESPQKEILDYWWAGQCYYLESDYANATTVLTQMTTLRPDEPSGHYSLGKVGMAQDGDGSKALGVPHFKKYLELVEEKPENAGQRVTAMRYLSVSAINNKKFAEAKKYANAVLGLSPEDGTAKQVLGALPK